VTVLKGTAPGVGEEEIPLLEPAASTGQGAFKARGAYFTPPAVAAFLAGWAVRSSDDKVLEPTCGEAAFLAPVVDALVAHGASSSAAGSQLIGFDIDAATVRRARAVLLRRGIDADLRTGSFFDVAAPDELCPTVPYVQAVVGNPPFIRYQHFGGEVRSASQRAALAAGVRLSGLASSWAASLVHASRFLAPGGRLAMVLPAELLTVNYAEPVRTFLRHRFAEVNLVMFEELVFDGVLENVVLLLAEGEGGCDHFRLHHVSDEDELLHGLLDSPTRVSTSGRATGKWTDLVLVDPSVRALQVRHVEALCTRLDTYGRPTLGVVTGANRFFALRPSEVRNRSIPLQHLVPITPPGHRRPRGRAFTKGDWLALAEADEPVHLLRLRGPVDRGPVAQLITEAEAEEVHASYKCRIRDPWYVLPPVPVPDLFVTYMSNHVPRLITNAAGAGHLNSLHGIQLPRAHRRLGRAALPLACLNTLSLLGAETAGRAYGGGVLKLEPREAAGLPVLSPAALAAAWQALRTVAARLDRLLRSGQWGSVTEEVDDLVLVKALGVPSDEVALIRQAASDLRDRRLNRGR
jgi:adenine-specific DNA-methyltransferase